MNSAADVWAKVLELLSKDLTATALATWFDDCRAIDIGDNVLVLYTPSTFKKDVIEGRFLGAVKSALREIFSGEFDVRILSDKELDSYSLQPPPGTAAA